METHSHTRTYIGIFIIIALLGLLGYGYTEYVKLSKANAVLTAELESKKTLLATNEEKIFNIDAMLAATQQEYAASEENGAELLRLLNEEKARNDDFEDQIDDITGTVGKLDKLSKTDPELLIKYSRIYFLNENYKPERLSEISSEYIFTKGKTEYISSKIENHLEDLLQNAKDDGINLLIVSAFRSFDQQMSLKNAYTTIYGSGANAFSADQGYSEHQLGTTLDFTTTEIGGGLNGFETTQAYEWLEKNAYRYGFVLSYPKDNSFYIFEPWHWRFVGVKLARDLHNKDKYFYNLDQREIDKYLISFYD